MEVYNYELKSKLTDKFLKTVSAFANYNDGRIVFGLNNEGQSIGIGDLDEIKLSIENKINDAIKPRPEFKIDIDFENSSVILTIYEGKNKPYYYHNKAYKRCDSSDTEVDREELSDLILYGKNLDYEQLISTYQNLSFDYFDSEAISRMGIDDPNLDLLKSFDLYSDKNGFNKAASLISDKNNYNIIDLVKFGSSINDIDFRKTIKNISILQAFNQVIDYYNQYYKPDLIEGKERKSIERIPYEAFREALANALVHRRWDRDGYVSIGFYNDRIEISSPGGLPNNISEEEYLNRRISSPRNLIISNIFYRLRYIEKLGTGVYRIKEAYKSSNSQAIFDVSENYVTVILPVIEKRRVTELSDEAQEILMLLNTYDSLSRADLELKTGHNKTKIIRVLNELIDYGMVEVLGRGRATKYQSIK
ncbi:ATP-binding protein [Anaerococcus sp.]|jgi:ATP-dependent DNA helicase recG|uniref:ATP-binding protein n=1 Tax=Anaerococcus sp. TaxID=1872515 RepID=UPI00290178B6|nr:ATP-binding protein [Anaerococcus sp.]MDU1827996.1 ATP-binding protein [Anaerococcus sp.]MDU1863854.1 ATP-binding protein [Anaerococcus sp.]